MLKLNLGCGNNLIDGYINVDKAEISEPNYDFICWTLDNPEIRWPWEANSISRVKFTHSLEHMGQTEAGFFHVIKSLYRVCIKSAEVEIHVPHPRHDDFINDPTHVRIITPELLSLFSKKFNRKCIAEKWSNTTLGLYLDVDFEITDCNGILSEPYNTMLNTGQIKEDYLQQLISTQNNIVKEYHIKMKVIK